jgi:hypothetical protein
MRLQKRRKLDNPRNGQQLLYPVNHDLDQANSLLFHFFRDRENFILALLAHAADVEFLARQFIAEILWASNRRLARLALVNPNRHDKNPSSYLTISLAYSDSIDRITADMLGSTSPRALLPYTAYCHPSGTFSIVPIRRVFSYTLTDSILRLLSYLLT